MPSPKPVEAMPISPEVAQEFFSGLVCEPLVLPPPEILPPARPVKETALEMLRLWGPYLTPGSVTEWCLQMLCHADDIHSRLVTLEDRCFVAVNLIRYVMLNLPSPWGYQVLPEAEMKRLQELAQEWRSQVGGAV